MFKIMTLVTLANLSCQSQGGRLWIRKTPPSRNHNPESHNPENHNPETEHNRGPNNPAAAQAGVGVRRWPRIGEAGWKMGVDVVGGMGVRDKNRARWGHLAPEKRTQGQLHREFSACGTIQNFSEI